MPDSIKAVAFFSRPFDKRLDRSVDYIRALCKGIDVETICVDRPGPDVPVDEANGLIKSADFLIAICSKVYKIDGGDVWLTSTAVREEIAAAQAMGKKVALFFEAGVASDGFAKNRATSYNLENCENLSARDLESVLYGIHKAKLQSVDSGGDVFHTTGVKNFRLSQVNSQIELRETSRGLLWEYTTEKTFNFEADHDLPLTSAAYCMQQISGCKCAPLFKSEFRRNGVSTEPTTTALQEAGFVELKRRFDPLPVAGDTIFIRDKFQSPFPRTNILG